ncbi:MAG: trypsin-like serine protease, partial [Polyangiaceae bacterium]
MRPWYGVGALVLVCVASCGGKEPAVERIGTATSPIQGGTTDTTDSFAVGIVQTSQLQSSSMVAFCSGVLLAPNLVATARHCVAQLASATIDCSTSTFGPVISTQYVWVTTDAVMNLQNGVLQDGIGVSSIVVPSQASQTSVCGNDIALLILSQSIALPQYVMPTLNPPMTDPGYEATVSAIGYGIDTPTDTMGTSAGTRRIKQNVPLQCIPNDPTPSFDCFMQDQTANTYMAADEFISGDSTCEGDSGSGAFEQGHF